MPPEERNGRILERLQQVTRYAYERSSFYRRRWDRAGFHPDHLGSLEDFEEKVPVITKQDLRESQARVPSFGDYLCIPGEEIHHIHGTSGTTGQPTAFAVGRGDWEAIGNAHARIMWGMGLRPGDTLFIASLFSLYWGSWGTLIGSERLRAKSFPFGAGAPGMTARAVGWLRQIKPTGFYSTPSYALHLAETARSQGIDPAEFGLKIMFFSGEPGASVPGVRDRIQQAFGARVVDSGSMAEMTPWMNCAGTAETEGMLLWQDLVYTEVCDPATFRRIPFGQRGTPRLHPPGEDFAAHDSIALGGPGLVGGRAHSLRAHLSPLAQRHLRPHRRRFHHSRRERLSQRDRCGAQFDGRLRGRAPHRDFPRADHG